MLEGQLERSSAYNAIYLSLSHEVTPRKRIIGVIRQRMLNAVPKLKTSFITTVITPVLGSIMCILLISFHLFVYLHFPC
jgi:hypothetical protein